MLLRLRHSLFLGRQALQLAPLVSSKCSSKNQLITLFNNRLPMSPVLDVAARRSATSSSTSSSSSSSKGPVPKSGIKSGGPASKGPGQATPDEAVIEMSEANVASIQEMSHARLVLIDCYADWCGPCKQLTPVLEKIARGSNGTVTLAKLNTETMPQLAESLQVSKLPTVLLISKGRVLTAFSGVQPEADVIKLIEKVTGAPYGSVNTVDGDVAKVADSEALLKKAEQLLETRQKANIGAAAQLYTLLLQTPEAEDKWGVAVAGLARCALIGDNDVKAARAIIDRIKSDSADSLSHPFVAATTSMLELAEEAAAIGKSEVELRSAVSANADDLQARFNLMLVLSASGQMDAAMDEGIQVLRKDRNWNEGAVRKHFLRLFQILGPAHAFTKKGRGRLSMYIV